ncbi:MAG: DEAD/DEAH box helicase, partial [Gammaproteobacteria bacterium]|nr:DEAD/DEAH box helicase [Gammaproteobacteria bacterium]
MSAFDRLHPALQHHIVNTLAWRSLRPLQAAAIAPILAGEHAILLAPTAGGKTEAAVLPVLSRALTEDWQGLGILYICPIKALLNNLEPRLAHYAGMVGRRAALWHGDVGASSKGGLLREPPEILLTTPESLEGMLVSRRVDHRRLFGDLHTVIIDELHAFAGDDRGWHLLYLLRRLSHIAGRELQRLGLSATVGNPRALCDWLADGCERPRRVLDPAA